MSTVQTGGHAEQAVAEELSKQGYKIIELNWRTKFAEIDIVAGKSKTMYFVEVKYRSTLSAGDGFEYITPTKLHHMNRAAEAWVLEHDWQGPYELMAVAVHGETGQFQIEIREI